MHSTVLFNDGWNFSKQPLGKSFEEMQKNVSEFSPVEIPHDWLIYNTNDLYETSVGWYRKNFTVKLNEGEKILIAFDGVYMDSTLFVNGKQAGEWKYGYSQFRFDITEFLKDGDNELILRVVHQSPNSRWYSGAGVYRNVWLITEPAAYLVTDGVYISTKCSEEENTKWTAYIDAEVSFDKKIAAADIKNYSVRQSVLVEGEMLVSSGISSPLSKTRIFNCYTGHEDYVYDTSIELPVKEPIEWDIDNPYQYDLKTELLLGDKVVDEIVQKFGFRTIKYDTEEGFLLNGRKVKLHGVCLHHDLGALGSAFNKAAMRRQIEVMKKMGVNAIRTSHNMPAPGLMELCAEMGILVDCEAFDMWVRPKTEFDYARFFKTWARRDVGSWVRNFRNKPCVIMWSVGNEIYDTHADPEAVDITKKLSEYVYASDPRQNARVTIGSNYMPWEGAQKCADVYKLAGYNYAEKYYEQHHKAHPDWVIYGSETASTLQSRGIYHFPLSQQILADDDEQCSSLGNCTTSWGSKSIQYNITADRDAHFCCGQFMWTGFDYIGEPTPYQTKNSYFGAVDTAGFPKDAFYQYAAEWTSYKKSPMVHIYPFWNFNPGQMIDVNVVSNAPKIELFFNGKSLGTYDFDHEHGTDLVAKWQLPYEEGELIAKAYDENGDVIATDRAASFLDAENIVVDFNKETLKADGEDIIFVEISMTDKNGNPVADANNRVDVSVTGAARLVGLDNGDSTDFDQYKGTSRRLFSGKLLAMIKATDKTGDIELTISSEGLKSYTKVLKAVEAEEVLNPSLERMTFMKNEEVAHDKDIPVREILIKPVDVDKVTVDSYKMTKDKPYIDLALSLCPANATHTELVYRLTTEAGIDSNIAEIEELGSENLGDGEFKRIRVKALGDGTVMFRAMCKNGTDKIHIISVVTIKIDGIGAATLDPYEFIAGGLYSKSAGDIQTGIQRGFAICGKETSEPTYAGFENVDFGDYGSDEITVPFYAIDNQAYKINLWLGEPNKEGSELLYEMVFNKPQIWQTYQEETFKLKKRIRGIKSIYFESKQSIHIKGFIFKKYDKTFEKIYALENNQIYGDTFTVTPDEITGIGNNVSLIFKGFHFGIKGMTKLIICGHSPIDKNTIHVRFTTKDGDIDQLCEFTKSDGFTERIFTLDEVNGDADVTFVFLPGCNFDFRYFRFAQD